MTLRRAAAMLVLLVTFVGLSFQASPGAAQTPEKPQDTLPQAPPEGDGPAGSWDGRSVPGPSSVYGSQTFFDSIGAPIAIPDAGAPITNSIVVPDSFPIVDLNVHVDIPHTWVGDLAVTLTHDDTGTSATLIDRPGTPPGTFGCSQNNIDATLDDEAANPAEST